MRRSSFRKCLLVSGGLSCGLMAFFVLLNSTVYAVDEDNLVGAWLFDGEGENILDSSKNKLHGVISEGAPKRVNDGMFGKAMEFAGADMITVAHRDVLDLSSFTLAAWVKVLPGDLKGIWLIVASKESRAKGFGRNYGMFVDHTKGTVLGSVTAPWDAWQGLEGPTKVADGEWRHITIVLDKLDFTLYVDGVVDGNRVVPEEPVQHDDPLFIGGWNGATQPHYWMTGKIDELVLFDTALSEDEVSMLKDGGIAALNILAVGPQGKLSVTWGDIKDQ